MRRRDRGERLARFLESGKWSAAAWRLAVVVVAAAVAVGCGAVRSLLGAEIEAPERIDAHRPVVCRCATEADSYGWLVFSREFDVVEVFSVEGSGGSEVVWVGPPGKYLVDVQAMTGGKIDRGQRIVLIGEAPPTPPEPDPEPEPDPDNPDPPDPDPVNPDLPDDRWGLAKWVYGRREQIKQHRGRAGAVAAAFTSTSQAINDRQVASVGAAFARLKEKTQAAVPSGSQAAAEWGPLFEAINAELIRRRDADEISALDDLGGAFAALGAGIEAMAPAGAGRPQAESRRRDRGEQYVLGRDHGEQDSLRRAAQVLIAKLDVSAEEAAIAVTTLGLMTIGAEAEVAAAAGKLADEATRAIALRTARFGRDGEAWRPLAELAAGGDPETIDERLRNVAGALKADR